MIGVAGREGGQESWGGAQEGRGKKGNKARGGRIRRVTKEVAPSRYPKALWTGNNANGFIPHTYGRCWRPNSTVPPHLNAVEVGEYIAAYTSNPDPGDRRHRSLQETQTQGHQARIHVQKKDVEDTFDVKAKSGDVGYYYQWWEGIHSLCGHEGFLAKRYKKRPRLMRFP